MVNITIDDKKLQVPEDTTVLRAAEMAGINIPTLCDHPELTPFGGCRLCLVDVEGAPRLQTSCTLPVSNNMVVHTDTEKVRKARKFALTLIFSERNHFCPYCTVTDGDCELQNAAYAEGMTHWDLQPNWKPYTVDASHPYILLEQNRCILCRRCVRACDELVGNFTLGFEERGANSILIADLGIPLGESSCVSCGTCVQVCPTGALIDRLSAYRGHDRDLEHNRTVCIGCSVGCGIDVQTRDNHLVRINGDWDSQVNNGIICDIGRFLPLAEDRERLKEPLTRENGELKVATWNDAMEKVAKTLKPLIGKNGTGIAAMISTRLPAEAMYLFRKIFIEYIKSDMVTNIEENHTSAAPARMADELGSPFEGTLETIKAAECAVIIGADLVDNHQVAGFFIKRNLPNGVKLIIIDPNTNPLNELADYTLKGRKDTDLDIIQGLTAATEKLGSAKSDSISQPNKIIKNASENSGIPYEIFLNVARTITSSQHPVFIYGKGLTANGSEDILKALLELARVSGAFNEKLSGLISMKGQANSLTAAQYRLDKPFHSNGYQAVYLALGDDYPSRRLIKRIEKVPFLVVQASYASKLTAIADVVLPVEMWAELEGHYLNLEGRLQTAKKALIAPEEVRSNKMVLKDLATRLGFEVDINDWKGDLLKRVPIVAISEN